MRAASLLAAFAILLTPLAHPGQEKIVVVDINHFDSERRARGAADARADFASGNLAVYGTLGHLMFDTLQVSEFKARSNEMRTLILSEWGLRSRQHFNACIPLDPAVEAYRDGYAQAAEPLLQKTLGANYEQRIIAEIARRLAVQDAAKPRQRR